MPHYWVISPQMSRVEPVLDNGTGPLEYFRCCCCVDAKNRREAKKIAIKHPDMKEWVKSQRSDKANPFASLKVQNAKCKHGICTCEFCGGGENFCDICADEADMVVVGEYNEAL